MSHPYRNAADGQTVALQVIGWIVSDSSRVERFLALTGLDPQELRDGLSDKAVLGAALDFLMAHEPDLLACAEAIDIPPVELVAARGAIS